LPALPTTKEISRLKKNLLSFLRSAYAQSQNLRMALSPAPSRCHWRTQIQHPGSGVVGTDTQIFNPEIDRCDFYRGRRRSLQRSGGWDSWFRKAVGIEPHSLSPLGSPSLRAKKRYINGIPIPPRCIYNSTITHRIPSFILPRFKADKSQDGPNFESLGTPRTVFRCQCSVRLRHA
jgi:hypothetical protein